jgi:anti-sigma-K factor RskA
LAGQVRELQSRLDRAGGALPFPNDPGVRALLLLGTPKSPEARGAVFWSGQERKARLYTSRLPQLSGEQTYQLWLIADEPVGAGTFRVDPAGQGYLEVVDLDRAASPVEFAVSLESAGGARRLMGDVYLTGSY